MEKRRNSRAVLELVIKWLLDILGSELVGVGGVNDATRDCRVFMSI
jgi:hypothetical protein